MACTSWKSRNCKLQNVVTHLQNRGWSVSCDFRAVVLCKGFDVKCVFLKSSLSNVKLEIMKLQLSKSIGPRWPASQSGAAVPDSSPVVSQSTINFNEISAVSGSLSGDGEEEFLPFVFLLPITSCAPFGHASHLEIQTETSRDESPKVPISPAIGTQTGLPWLVEDRGASRRRIATAGKKTARNCLKRVFIPLPVGGKGMETTDISNILAFLWLTVNGKNENKQIATTDKLFY